MADSEVVPSIWDLDYTDLTFYQHPPFTFVLWYVAMLVKAGVDFIIDLTSGEGGGEGGGEEGGEGGEEEAPAEEAPPEEAPPEEAPPEEAPPEEPAEEQN